MGLMLVSRPELRLRCKDPGVEGSPPYEPREFLERVRALPAAAPLLERLGDAQGVFLVGGAVRDLLRGESPPDLDLEVEGDPDELISRLGGVVRRHQRFGTATVELEGFIYDVAAARRERYPEPGALPEVHPASAHEDLTRRDFTVNAMAVALSGPRGGELISVPGALSDLRAGVLRVLHDRSFEDDPTRLFRLARYASRLRFELEPGTERLARAAVDQAALSTVSPARIGSELKLLALEARPVEALQAAGHLSLDRALHPAFGLADPPLARRALGLLPADGRADLLALAVAARDVPADELIDLLERLAFDASARDRIAAAAIGAPAAAMALETAASDSAVAAALAGAPPELAALAGALGPSARAADWLARLRHVQLEIDGRDLIGAGVPEGPAVGHGLQAALGAKLDGRASGREAELAEALRAAR